MGAEYFEHGTRSISPVVTSGWDDDGRSIGLFFVNVASTSSSVTVETDPARHGLSFLNYARSRIESTGTTELGAVSGVQSLALDLPSRTPVLLRLQPAACGAPTCLYRVFREGSATALAGAVVPLLTVQGHQWDDPGLADGIDRYYLVDDGGGFPGTIAVDKAAGTVRLSW